LPSTQKRAILFPPRLTAMLWPGLRSSTFAAFANTISLSSPCTALRCNQLPFCRSNDLFFFAFANQKLQKQQIYGRYSHYDEGSRTERARYVFMTGRKYNEIDQ